ncbi:hypothetical protein A2765_05040 [Candidatus Kaiserbacteria bacterium RIFCSPHIGHO2_01_FULL_56_24]|uniref:RNHCP domain-containing protein n=1 Tax=Candidatus Kaiserbacteria bacterium RIFCSPHIGHO2_01_FULL_56_24 TaxID=1798487 RepID=A0A1F6D8J8_9BACT|nr:MAG: hypothetical protein A2765_05040 [Candidatus Kaiserbacteria bacterium RIFCSPHIGHO2_01_FULL_56_24]
MMSFERKIEDFTCGHCNHGVKGSGYTNHCPKCLYSRHVDINPGDRAESCGGMMEPIRIEGTVGKYRIIHRCAKCGAQKPNAVADTDDPEAVIRCAQRASDR